MVGVKTHGIESMRPLNVISTRELPANTPAMLGEILPPTRGELTTRYAWAEPAGQVASLDTHARAVAMANRLVARVAFSINPFTEIAGGMVYARMAPNVDISTLPLPAGSSVICYVPGPGNTGLSYVHTCSPVGVPVFSHDVPQPTGPWQEPAWCYGIRRKTWLGEAIKGFGLMLKLGPGATPADTAALHERLKLRSVPIGSSVPQGNPYPYPLTATGGTRPPAPPRSPDRTRNADRAHRERQRPRERENKKKSRGISLIGLGWDLLEYLPVFEDLVLDKCLKANGYRNEDLKGMTPAQKIRALYRTGTGDCQLDYGAISRAILMEIAEDKIVGRIARGYNVSYGHVGTFEPGHQLNVMFAALEAAMFNRRADGGGN